ncbi:MAG: TGS domain-containing protein [Asgard group archaeon]|nr:TGS domain-containing protein [Asgard group archaeon]
MDKNKKLRYFKLKVANRLWGKHKEDFAEEIDIIIDEIQQKKLDQHLQFKQYIDVLKKRKAEELATPTQKAKQYDPFQIPQSGVGRIALFGLSNVGKSTLMNKITNTDVDVGNFLHTTQVGQAGGCQYEDVTYQIVDLPGFLDFKEDWEISKQIVRVARTSEAIMMVIDLSMDITRQVNFLVKQLENAGLIENGEIAQKIGVIATKGDLPGTKEAYKKLCKLVPWKVHPIAYNNEAALQQLKQKLFDELEIIRIYTKAPGQEANLSEPLVLPKGATVEDVAEKIHTSFPKRFRYARIWGPTSEFDGQQVGLEQEVQDKDIVEIIIRK